MRYRRFTQETVNLYERGRWELIPRESRLKYGSRVKRGTGACTRALNCPPESDNITRSCTILSTIGALEGNSVQCGMALSSAHPPKPAPPRCDSGAFSWAESWDLEVGKDMESSSTVLGSRREVVRRSLLALHATQDGTRSTSASMALFTRTNQASVCHGAVSVSRRRGLIATASSAYLSYMNSYLSSLLESTVCTGPGD